ncbi:efflux RND transporter periplasmic adaptor subunit [Parasulfitobacter algicola]|uniref:efflux RND transporter periplasmic adaptor subunit n=1 Tax=Parasulfitobacter algicola TaxID=2614809 RepID=UPI0031B6153C
MGLAAFSMFSAIQTRLSDEPDARPARERVFAVNTITVTPKTLIPEMTVFGEVQSRRTLELRSAVAGTLVELASEFEEGGQVKNGQLLAQIDPADMQSALDRAKADILQAEAEVRDADRALQLARDELAVAEEQNLLRQRAFVRQQDLRERGVGTDASVEIAELEASSARQSVVARRQSLAQAEARLDQSKTALLREQIDLAEAERRLADTNIYAAFTGTLSDVSAVQGARITSGEQLARLVDPDQLEVRFRLSTAQYARLLDQNGGLQQVPVNVTLDVLGFDHIAQGMVTRESAAVGEGQTGRLLFATLDQPLGFKPGDFVTVRIAEPALDNVVKLPSAAVGADQTVLVLDDDDRLEVSQVQLMRRQDNDVIVTAPTLAGRDIVAERTPLLGAGIKVRRLNDNTSDVVEMLMLSPERRTKLITFVEENDSMPDAAKARILGQLKQDQVPASVVTRLESRMGS